MSPPHLVVARVCVTLSAWCALFAILAAVHPLLPSMTLLVVAGIMLREARDARVEASPDEPCEHRNRYAPGPRMPKREAEFGRVIETKGRM